MVKVVIVDSCILLLKHDTALLK